MKNIKNYQKITKIRQKNPSFLAENEHKFRQGEKEKKKKTSTEILTQPVPSAFIQLQHSNFQSLALCRCRLFPEQTPTFFCHDQTRLILGQYGQIWANMEAEISVTFSTYSYAIFIEKILKNSSFCRNRTDRKFMVFVQL